MKKAQVKMLETIAVLIIFFFIIAMGFSFYGKIKMININRKIMEIEEINSIKKANRVYFLPELECLPSLEEINCIDKLKLDSFKEVIDENEIYYIERFGTISIRIKEIYPEKEEWEIYNKKKEEYKRALPIIVPVKLYDPITKDISFGLINITYYS